MGKVGYRTGGPGPGPQSTIWVEEDPTLVLLGGEIWPAAWAACEHLERTLNEMYEQVRQPVDLDAPYLQG
jgi:hypothetical protein